MGAVWGGSLLLAGQLWPSSFPPVRHAIERKRSSLLCLRPLRANAAATPRDDSAVIKGQEGSSGVGGASDDVLLLSGRRIAVLAASKSASVAVSELARPLAEYMTLPASQYSVLDAKRIERLDADTFRCYVGGLRFLSVTVEPVLTLSVIVGETGPTVQLLSTKLQGPKAVEALNDRFSATMTNVVTWQEAAAASESGKQIASDTSIQVRLAVPAWFVLPTQVIESAGCTVMARVLDTAVPKFLQQLKADYELWAAGNDERQPVAHGELT